MVRGTCVLFVGTGTGLLRSAWLTVRDGEWPNGWRDGWMEHCQFWLAGLEMELDIR